jgi:ABC-type bacteriocin/lantibiotic exporter with double-glycine peptidase domain
MGRIIGTVLGVILAIWLAVTAAGGIFATLKTFVIIGLIAMAVFIIVWLVAGRPHRARAGADASSGGDHQAEDENGQGGRAPGGDG